MSSKISASSQDTSNQGHVRTPQNENKTAGSVVLFALAFWIPQTIWGRSDSAGEH